MEGIEKPSNCFICCGYMRMRCRFPYFSNGKMKLNTTSQGNIQMIDELTTEESEKLQRFAATTLINTLRENVPSEIKHDTQELMSEIWNAYFYILKSYKPGPVSRTSYCFKYAAKIAMQNILNEHKTQKSYVSLETLLKEPQTMKTPETEMIEQEDKIELDRRIKEVIDIMSPRDFDIATMYMRGITMEKIAEIHKITPRAVYKILRKYANRI